MPPSVFVKVGKKGAHLLVAVLLVRGWSKNMFSFTATRSSQPPTLFITVTTKRISILNVVTKKRSW
jgi:hypothetical protein